MENQKIKAVGYCRFSSDMQREESIDAQKRYISVYAAQGAYEITNFYCDRARSGKNTKRPAFQQMLADAKQGKFQAIIVHKLDRFSRSTEDTLRIINELKDFNVSVVSAYEHFENNAIGDFMLKIISGMSEWYISNLANEVLKGQRENAYKCLSNGGRGCLGYDIVDQKYVVNEEEAESVRLIFQMYSNGYGYNSIIDRLNALGKKTKAGRPFGKNSLYAILNNEKYTGVYIFNQIARGNSQGKRNSHKKKPNSEIIRIEGGVPAIISKELWNRVQAIRQINPKGKSHNKHFYLLSGLIYCGECGSKMHGNPRNTGNGGPTYLTSRCNNRDNSHSCSNGEVRKEYVEGFVIEELFDHFFNRNAIPEITRQLNKKLQEKSNSSSDEYKEYRATLKVLKKSRDNLVEAIEKTGYNQALGDKLKNVEKQIEDCGTFLQKYEDRHKNISAFTEEQVLKNLSKIKEFAKGSHKEEVRAMVQRYVDRVTVFHDRVEVVFKVAFHAEAENSTTFHCDSSVTRYNLEQYSAASMLEKAEIEEQKNLHTA